MDTTEKRFETDIESFLISAEGGYTRTNDTYDKKECLYVDTLINFIKRTQPKEWARFEKSCNGEPAKKFCDAFDNAVEMDGLIAVMRNGFKYRGIGFKVCFFKPESHLNKTADML